MTIPTANLGSELKTGVQLKKLEKIIGPVTIEENIVKSILNTRFALKKKSQNGKESVKPMLIDS